jgi:predicted nucleic acid-binding protein
MPVIYLMERNPTYYALVLPFFTAVDRGEITVVTSTVTLLEVLVLPLRLGNAELAQRYRSILLAAKGVTVTPLTEPVAELAAQLRAEHNIRTPDAIQLATAVYGGASHFLTNDARLPALPGLSMLVIDTLKAGEAKAAG